MEVGYSKKYRGFDVERRRDAPHPIPLPPDPPMPGDPVTLGIAPEPARELGGQDLLLDPPTCKIGSPLGKPAHPDPDDPGSWPIPPNFRTPLHDGPCTLAEAKK